MSKATKTRDSREGLVRFCGFPAVTRVTIVVITTIVKRKVRLRSRAGARGRRAARRERKTQERFLAALGMTISAFCQGLATGRRCTSLRKLCGPWVAIMATA